MKQLFLVILAASLMTGCSRAGFSDSLDTRKNGNLLKDNSSSSSQSSSVDSAPVSKVLTMEMREKSASGYYIAYSVPSRNGVNDEAAKLIEEKIDAIIDEISKGFDLSQEGANLEIYDSVGIIDENFVSLFYEGSFTTKAMKNPTKFAFGLNFSAKTGGQLTVTDAMQPHTLASLITDEQSSKVLGKEELREGKRKALSEMGLTSIADRIIAADSQRDMDNLFAFSYYLEKGKLVAIIPMSGDGAEPAMVSVMSDKA
ncbi:MAG: hypothetical protein RR315_03475 [Oscillospiraceae bacterium]